MSLLQSSTSFYSKYPLRTILLVGLFLRLLAAIFSEGYAFHDDHFCVTRVAQSWADGIPHWLESEKPPKHSMFYAGINAVIIWGAENIGITDTFVKTALMRVFHALYSLLTILFVYKITLTLADVRRATLAGWIVALLWFMPFMSVRFLVELMCVPPVLAGFYLMIKEVKAQQKSITTWLLAGALFGLAFTFRYHTILFAGGLGLVLLYQKRWLPSIVFSLGYLVVACLIVGTVDLVFFDYPFHSLVEYFAFNSENANNFISGSPFKFTLTTFGFLVPPVSLMLMFGYARSAKIEPMMFVAVLVFFVFHSAFPNQQERFILPMFPLLIILGVIGWSNFVDNSTFWQKYKGLHNGAWKFFWIANILVAVALAFTFTKKDRVAPMYYLSQKADLTSLIIENEKSVKQPPVYYLGKNVSDFNEWDEGILGINEFLEEEKFKSNDYRVVFSLPADKTIDSLKQELNFAGKSPNYIIFQGANNLEQRIERIQPLYKGKELKQIKVIHPSNFDRLLHKMNPRIHRDQTAFIYKAE